MGFFGRTFVLACAIAGAGIASQAPEFSQQYRQRLGGAIVELRQFVEDFDADARDNGLNRAQALSTYATSGEKFLNDRGRTMQAVLDRYESLLRQQTAFQKTPALFRPLAISRDYDRPLLEGTWSIYEPAIPVNMHGFSWAAAGFLVAGFLAWLLARLLGAMTGTRRPSRRYR